MNVAIVCSNNLSLRKNTLKGTEIIVWTFLHEMGVHPDEKLHVTAFASGDSDVPVELQSISEEASSANHHISSAKKHIIFELALISKALAMQDRFDLYHIHIGDGDLVLPFTPFVHKPILITMYHPADERYAQKYYDLFKQYKNVYFVTPTDSQQKRFTSLPYAGTVPHGIDAKEFAFDAHGGNDILWAGRAVPDKGMDIAMTVAKQTKKRINLFGILKKDHESWVKNLIESHKDNAENISIEFGKNRFELIKHFQSSKLFLFPIQWEEPFGLVLIEAMACGTPVVAYSRGSIPEVIKDGETGFIVNPSDDDIRGDFIIKKTGIEGLNEAVDRIYGLSTRDYETMRTGCRARVEKYFTVQRMIEGYKKIYETIVSGETLSYGTSNAPTSTR